MESELADALDDLAHEASRRMAEDLRDEMESELRESYQEAPELVRFMSEVQEEGDGFTIQIEHPTAPLHERGGNIEPTYATAMTLGWTRDGFYEALTDCNEWVERKQYTFSAIMRVDSRWGER
jgi:hypothetical protein